MRALQSAIDCCAVFVVLVCLAFLEQTTDYSTAFKDLAYFASTLFSLSGTICLAAPYWYNTLVFADEPHRKTDFLAALISQHCPANSPKHATRQCSWVCPCCVQIYAYDDFSQRAADWIGRAPLHCRADTSSMEVLCGVCVDLCCRNSGHCFLDARCFTVSESFQSSSTGLHIDSQGKPRPRSGGWSSTCWYWRSLLLPSRRPRRRMPSRLPTLQPASGWWQMQTANYLFINKVSGEELLLFLSLELRRSCT